MRSFAIWYDKKKNCVKSDKKPKIQVHVNLWEQNICDGERGEVCFDFGFLIHYMDNIEKLNLYCPFSIEKSDVLDLGEKIHQHLKLVNTIFNEDYKPTEIAPRYLSVQVPEDRKTELKENFLIYQLNESNFTVSDVDGKTGRVLSLNLADVVPQESHDHYDELKKFQRYYFRFRIFVDVSALKMISHRQKNISPFQDAFIETQVIDFRLNNLRSCNASIGDKFAKGAHFDIRSIHYLILRSVSDEIICHRSDFSSRLLEDELWSDYIEGLKENIVAYHFKSQNVDEFVVLVRFEYKKRHWVLLLWYLALVLLLGISAGFCVNFLYGACFYIGDYCVYGEQIFRYFFLLYLVVSFVIFIYRDVKEEGGGKKWLSKVTRCLGKKL